MAVIRNTNTKIILGLPDISDRELVGKAASLNDNQIIELSRLKTGIAAVYQNNWLEPVLCHVNPCSDDEKKYIYDVKENEVNKNIKMEIVNYLMLNYCECSIKFLVYLDEIRSKEYNFLYTILYFGKAEDTL